MAGSPEFKALVKAKFEHYDKNKSGAIGLDEVAKVCLLRVC